MRRGCARKSIGTRPEKLDERDGLCIEAIRRVLSYLGRGGFASTPCHTFLSDV